MTFSLSLVHSQSSLTADHIVLAVGGRPRIPENVSVMPEGSNVCVEMALGMAVVAWHVYNKEMLNFRTHKLLQPYCVLCSYTMNIVVNIIYTMLCMYPQVSGALKYVITSDDLFSLQRPPGKT